MKSRFLLPTIIISLALIVCMWIFSGTVKNRNKAENTISVTGLSERNFESDLIVWKSQFSVKNMNLTAAYAELKKQSDATREFLVSKGIPEDEFTFSAVDINKDYIYSYNNVTGSSTSTFDGYSLTQSISVTSYDVEKIERVSREITELINKGIEITSFAPQYYYTKLADLKIEMLAEASQDGYLRAKTLADNGKGKLGSLINSSQGVFQIVAQNSSENYSWGGTFNTSSKNKTASVTAKMEYALK